MGTPLNVLMVEDSDEDTELVIRELRRSGYDVRFERVDTPQAMSAALENRAWDVVICDFSVPHFGCAGALRLGEAGICGFHFGARDRNYDVITAGRLALLPECRQSRLGLMTVAELNPL